jgi:hypothetical protein
MDSQINPSSYEWKMISSGENYPDFELDKDDLGLLLVLLYLCMTPNTFGK